MPVTSGTAGRFLLKTTAVGGQHWFHGMEAVMTVNTQTQPIVQRATNQEATKLRKRTMMTAMLGLVAFVLFAGAYVVEVRTILALESSDNWTQVYAP